MVAGRSARIVHSAGVAEGEPHHRWKWTRRRRRAVRLMVRGWPDTQVAAALGCHRNTLRHWRARAEFKAELAWSLSSHKTRVRLRRAYEIGLIADNLAVKLAEALRKLASNEPPDAQDIRALRSLAESYREARDTERDDLDSLDASIANARANRGQR